MSSPMVEIIREIPLVVDKDYSMESEDSGFPFDDDREDHGEEAPFRTQLDDIAARHPEFAQHLGSFPFRSGSRTRTQIPEHFTQQRFGDLPFGDRFERFGFPFEEPFKEEDQKPYYQRYPKYYPKQNSQEETNDPSCSNQESQSTNSDAHQDVDREEDVPERGRRPKQNIQQSNTVDLGQRQEPVDDRNQRSMSAPPPNNRPRYVSSINIPVNQPSEKANVAHDTPQTSAPSQPQERVIPIHVEGRDEPVIPRKFASQNTSQPQPHPQQPPHPCSDKFFTQRSPNFSQYFNRDQPFQNEWLPRGFHGKQPQGHQGQSNFNQGQRGRSPQPSAPKAEPTQQPTNVPRQAESQQKQPQVNVEPEQPKPQEPPKPQPSGKQDPIEQIKSIQKDVSELMGKVDQFSGKPRDKEYLYLDEMLTRNLIKLDNIDTQGQENIRQARKEAIKCIERCIGILESKANANVADATKAEGKQDESVEQAVSGEMEVENAAANEAVGESVTEAGSMEVEADAKAPTGESMEVESAEESQTQGDKVEPMEATDKPTTEAVESSNTSEETLNKTEEKENLEARKSVEKQDESNSQNTETEVENGGDKKEKKKIKKKVEKK